MSRLVSRLGRVGAVKDTLSQSSTRRVTALTALPDTADELLKPFEDIPGPMVLPFIGTLYKYLPWAEYSVDDALGTTMKKYNKYGPIMREHLHSQFKPVYLFHPEDIKTLFSAEGHYPHRGPGLPALAAYREMRGIPLGLTDRNGSAWHAIRSPIQKYFLRPRMIQSYIPAMEPCAEDLVALTRHTRDQHGEIEDYGRYLNKFALEMVGLVTLDTRLGTLQMNLAPDSEQMLYAQATNRMFIGLHRTTFAWDFHKRFPTGAFKNFCKDMDFITQTGHKHIRLAMERDARGEPGILGAQKSILMTLLSVPSLTEAEVMCLIMDLLMGGIETTQFTLSFILYLLARNPEQQEKLFQEIQRNAPPGQPLNGNVLDKMHYLKGVIKETMRIFPPIIGLPRVLDQDVVMSGYKVPKGTICQMGIDVIGRLPEYFPEPEKFRPERWLRQETGYEASDHPFAHIPFGFGTRSCIGRRFSETEIHIGLIKLFQNFRVEYHYEDIKLSWKLVGRPDRPLKFKFIER